MTLTLAVRVAEKEKKADLQEKVTVQMKMEKYVTSSMLESVMVMIGEL